MNTAVSRFGACANDAVRMVGVQKNRFVPAGGKSDGRSRHHLVTFRGSVRATRRPSHANVEALSTP